MFKSPTINSFLFNKSNLSDFVNNKKNKFKEFDYNIIKEMNKKREKEIVYEICFEDEIEESLNAHRAEEKKVVKKQTKKIPKIVIPPKKEKFVYEYNDYLEVNLCKGFHPLKHQYNVLEWQKARGKTNVKGGILALKMGLGKTAIALFRTASKCLISNKSLKIKRDIVNSILSRDITGIIMKYLPNPKVNPTLVVLPKSALITWKIEIKKFFGDQLKYLVFHRDEMKKTMDTITFQQLSKYHIILITYETLSLLAKKNKVYADLLEKDNFQRNAGINSPIYTKSMEKKLQTMKGGKILFYILWEDIYADESHRFSNPRSLTFYTMMSLHGKFKFALSGTPLNNYQSDLFTQLKWIGGCVDITNAKEFSYEYYIRQQLFKCIKIMNYEDAEIKLPEVISRVEILELTGKEKEIYEYYQNATRNVYNDFMIGSNNFASVLTMFLRLRQVCICPYTVLDKSARKYKEVKNDDYKIAQDVLDKLSGGLVSWLNNSNGTAGMYSTKINRIMEIIRNEIPKNESVVVFTNFKKVIDVIIKRFEKEKITYTIFDGDVKNADREKSIEMFRKNKAQVFLATLKAGSESLNLSDISHNVILSEIWYCPRAEDQAKSRVHRYGQTHVVNFWKLIFKDSIDERIEQICQGKRELAELFMGRGTKTTARLNASLLGQILNVKK